jgi:hypothetical protein
MWPGVDVATLLWVKSILERDEIQAKIPGGHLSLRWRFSGFHKNPHLSNQKELYDEFFGRKRADLNLVILTVSGFPRR